MILEGIPTSETRGTYGMPAGQQDNSDNSGTLKYVSIRHGGRQIVSGSELNGLSLGAVGSGTTLEYIEVYANSDDGIEFFGGAPNVKHAVVAICEDDSFDWDEAYSGKAQFWFSIQRSDIADAGDELDGSTPDDVTPFSNPVVYNWTHIGSGPGAAASNPIGWLFRAGTAGTVANSIMSETKGKGIEVQDKNAGTDDALQKLLNNQLHIKNNLFYNIGAFTTMDASSTGIIRVTSGQDSQDEPTAASLISHLNNNANTIANPGLQGVSRIQDNMLDPRPSATGAAYSTTLAAYPSDAFITPVSFKGAFGNSSVDLWVAGWTALHRNNHLKDFTSITDVNPLMNALTIYPNPAGDAFNILIDARDVTVEIINSFGQTVVAFTHSSSDAYRIDTATLAKGIYFVRISNAQSSISKKVIIE